MLRANFVNLVELGFMERLSLKNYFIIFLAIVVMLNTTGCCKKKIEQKAKRVPKTTDKEEPPKDISVPDDASKLLEKTGLSYSIDRRPSSSPPVYNAFSIFEKQYLDGVKKLEAGELDKAMTVFQEILKEYPEGEEASIAALCIAEIYFRSKNNEAALKLYREIIKKYPGTQAAQNAAEGIKYLESFVKHENSFVSPEVEDRKRRGR